MPSSRYLAKDAVRLVVEQLKQKQREPLSILELGPGTGIFTERILPNLKKGDHFDVVELNSYFFNILHRRFRFNGEVRLHHGDFLKFQPDRKYDFVISSLPYERIPIRVTRKMWERKLSYCKPGSYIIYYKYVNFNHFRSRFEKQLVRDYCHDEKIVFLNMPPARLFTLKINDPEKCGAVFSEEARGTSSFISSGEHRNGMSTRATELEPEANGTKSLEKSNRNGKQSASSRGGRFSVSGNVRRLNHFMHKNGK